MRKTEKTAAKKGSDKNQRPFFQGKLTVGPTDDAYEKEADAVAEQVMRMPIRKEESFFASKPLAIKPLVQPKCAACEEEESAQRKTSASIVQRDGDEDTPTPTPAPTLGIRSTFQSPFRSTTTPDFLGMRQPFINRGIFHLWEPDSALQVWNYNFNFFQRL